MGILSSSSIIAVSQSCNCAESFSWMKNTFEENDAGFHYVIDKKGLEDYNKHNLLFTEKIKNISSKEECQILMIQWLKYFRPGHIAVILKDPLVDGKTPSKEDIRNKFKNEKSIDLTENKLIQLLNKRKSPDPIEGIWTSDNYTIGILANEGQSNKYTAFIIRADSVFWMPGQLKAEFVFNSADDDYSVDYFMKDHSRQTRKAKFINASSNVFSMQGSLWSRLYPKSTLSKQEEVLLAFSNSNFPFVESLSKKTLYLRIPSFAAEQKKNIDSVLAKYDAQIKKTSNLIIDIRNGTGGGDASYAKIIPYLYTNPIRSIGVQFYSTELNAKAFEAYAKLYEDTSNMRFCMGIAKRMKENIGKFIDASDNKFEMNSLGKVLPRPMNVAIICNENNGSTDEQFLIDAKQSRKVKVYGRPTGGMLDISNMNMIDFPDGNFTLGYCMSKSYRIPNYTIDGVGIQPDYFLDESIPETDWVYYVKSMLEQ